MSGLSDAELSGMRSIINELLPDTCNILQVTRTKDGAGGWTESWGTASGGTAVACRLDSIGGIVNVVGGAVQSFHGWIMTLPYDTTITTANRIEHGSDTYQVITIDTDKSWKASVRVGVEVL